MEQPTERVDMMERKGKQLYEMISTYVMRRKQPKDEKRINEQIGYGFFYTDRTYGFFNDTLLTEALNAGLHEASLALAKYGPRANIGNVNSQGNYALLLACKKKYKDVIFELLKHQGNPCTPNNIDETPLLLAVADVNMIDVVPALLKHCDVNYINNEGKDAMELVFDVGNFEAFKLLLNDPKIELNSYDYELDGHLMRLTLLEYIYVTQFGNDYSENHKHARELLKVKGLDCFPLHIQNERKITALMFAVGDSGRNADDALYCIGKFLHFAEEKKNKRYVDFKNKDGFAAFDLLFRNALEDGKNVDVRVIKLFVDYYYKTNKNSRVFQRNIPFICNNPELFQALKELFPESKRELLDNACRDVVETKAELVVPIVTTPSPEIQVGKRTKKSSRSNSSEELAELIPIVHTTERTSPLPLWAQVSDTLEPGVRLTKRYSPTRGGKRKNKKTRKH